jgi:hypothetical protein
LSSVTPKLVRVLPNGEQKSVMGPGSGRSPGSPM